jgi:hypothetical protein
MTNKLIWLLIGIVVGILLTTYSVYTGPQNTTFKQTTDSLNLVISNLKLGLAKEDSIISTLNKKDAILSNKVILLAQERDKARAEAIRKASNSNLSNTDSLLKFFINRYPITDKLVLNLPKSSMMEAAHSLLLCDGTKEELILADSTILTLNERITIKDTTIISYQNKDSINKEIILTQDVKYDVLNKEYTKVNRQNKVLKLLTKTTSIIATAAIILFIIR